VEFIVQISDVASHDKNNAILSNIVTKLQDLLATVMAAIEAQSTKQTVAFQKEVTKLKETLSPNLNKKM
jgi:hypothetical protein